MNSLKIIDLHCDVLMKLSDAKGKLCFANSPELDVNFERIQQGGIKIQAFAIFVYPSVPSHSQFQEVIDQIHYFYTEVLAKHPEMKLIRNWNEIDQLADNEIGAILTFEGVDALGNDLKKLTILYELGVRSIGLTWNSGNLAADGIAESRNGGLTRFGRQLVEWNNKHKILTDVSHLSVTGFWDVMELAQYPIASHSNAKTICDHRRNLDDKQIKALIERDAMIHLVFCPPFVKQEGNATIDDLLKHIDHIVALGGIKNIGFGSDFDGIESKVDQLEHAAHFPNLINALLKHYSEDDIRRFMHQNFLDHRPR